MDFSKVSVQDVLDVLNDMDMESLMKEIDEALEVK